MKYTEMYNMNLSETVKCILGIEKLKNSSIFITGATGLICSALIDSLIYMNYYHNANIQVYAAGRSIETMQRRFGKFTESPFFTYVKYDANKEFNFYSKVDYIIHGASNAHPLAYSQQPVETMLSNFYGMNNLLEYAYKNRVTRTLYVSSSEIYGQKGDKSPYKESDYSYVDILNPRACYPSSKRAAETLCASYNEQYNIDVVLVRPGHIYGPTSSASDSRAAAQFARNVINGEDIILKSPGLQMRSYTYVFDCVSAILTVLFKGECGEAYNISNKNSVATIKELAEVFAHYGGRKVIFELPSQIEKNGYNLMESSVLNSNKLEGLGWSGLYTVEEGVKRTINILKEII